MIESKAKNYPATWQVSHIPIDNKISSNKTYCVCAVYSFSFMFPIIPFILFADGIQQSKQESARDFIVVQFCGSRCWHNINPRLLFFCFKTVLQTKCKTQTALLDFWQQRINFHFLFPARNRSAQTWWTLRMTQHYRFEQDVHKYAKYYNQANIVWNNNPLVQCYCGHDDCPFCNLLLNLERTDPNLLMWLPLHLFLLPLLLNGFGKDRPLMWLRLDLLMQNSFVQRGKDQLPSPYSENLFRPIQSWYRESWSEKYSCDSEKATFTKTWWIKRTNASSPRRWSLKRHCEGNQRKHWRENGKETESWSIWQKPSGWLGTKRE